MPQVFLGAFLVSVLLFVQPVQLMALSSAEPAACGFPTDKRMVERTVDGVPLLLKSGSLGIHGRGIFLTERKRSEIRYGAKDDSCPKTEAYLQGILDRLIKGSQLEEFAKEEPALRLEVECGRKNALPVGRALAGRMLLVPAGLPLQALSEDAIAAVISHELAHLTLRHTERFIEASFDETRAPASGGLDLPRLKPKGKWVSELKRSHEREADITGLRILVSAGYDPSAAIDHMKSLDEITRKRYPGKKPRRQDHDEPEQRAAMLAGQISQCGYQPADRRPAAGSEVRLELKGGL